MTSPLGGAAPRGDTTGPLREEFDRIRDAIEAAGMRDDPGLKTSLMDVYRTVDASLAGLGQLKEDIRDLVERWKAKRNASPVMAPQFNGARPIVHEDHIGASTFLERGWSKISLGDYEGAEEALTRALELAPNSTEGQSLLGWAQMLQDKLDAALMNFQYVLGREPANALARINVGYICLKKGIFGEAIEHLSKALRQDDDARARLYANFYLGLVYTEREMFDDAQIFFERSISLGPNLVEAYFELGHALWLGGARDRAIATWKRGGAVNKFNPWSLKCAEMAAIAERGDVPQRAWVSRGE